MDTNLNIINSKENEIEFDIEIDGLDASEKRVCFVIETSKVNFAFNCTHQDNNKWLVKIPPMPQIEHTLYPFHIEVVLDGYHFIPMNGTVNITKTADIYVKDMSNITFEPAIRNSDAVIKQVTNEPKFAFNSNVAAESETKNESAPSFKKNTEVDDIVKNILGNQSPAKTNVKKAAKPQMSKTETHDKFGLNKMLSNLNEDKTVETKSTEQSERDRKVLEILHKKDNKPLQENTRSKMPIKKGKVKTI